MVVIVDHGGENVQPITFIAIPGIEYAFLSLNICGANVLKLVCEKV
jgi:hypothetical protein